MSSQPMEGFFHRSVPLLDPQLLQRVQQLNRAYVSLLHVDSAAGVRQLSYFPENVRSQLLELGSSAVRSLTRAPYALYCLDIEAALAGSVSCPSCGTNVGTAEPPASNPQSAFCELAVLLAWHVAQLKPLTLRVVHAMSSDHAERLAVLSLCCVRQLSRRCSALLKPRWTANALFWPELVRSAATGDAGRLRLAHLLGHQLTAAEILRSRTETGGCAMTSRKPMPKAGELATRPQGT